VVIEFSTPATVLDHIEACFEAKVPIVVGTTGWYGHLQRIKNECEQNGNTFLYATNFSVG
jgi:4-hydroxy-tetrahydrodipicolinate reductase